MKTKKAICLLLLLTSLFQGAIAQCDDIQNDFIQPAIELREQNTREALLKINEGIAAFKISNCPEALARAYSVKGIILRNRGELENSLLCLDTALYMFTSFGDTVKLTRVYNNISSTKLYQSDYRGALIASIRAIELLQQLDAEEVENYWSNLSSYYINTANIFTELDSLSGIEAYYELAREAADKGGQAGDVPAIIDYNLALLYIGSDRLPEAEELLLANHNYYTKDADTFNLAMIEDALGCLENGKNDFEKARSHFEKSINFYQEVDDDSYIVTPQLNLARNFLDQNKPDEALSIAAQIQAGKSGDIENELELERIFIDAYSKLGQVDSLLNHVEKLDIIHLNNPYLANNPESLVEDKNQLAQSLKQTAIQLKKNSIGFWTIIIVLLLASMVTAGMQQYSKKVLARKKEAQQLQLERESLEKRFMEKIAQILMTVVSKKRAEVDGVLHDNICPRVIAVKRELEYFFQVKKEDIVKNAMGMLDTVYEQTRALIDGKELLADSTEWWKYMQLLITQFENVGNFKVNKYIHPGISKITADMGWHLTYITSVLLDNIELHSQAHQVNIDMLIKDNDLIMMVEDDGVGMNSKGNHSRSKGIGLKNTKYRVEEQLHGSMDIDSIPRKGTTINIKMPLK